MQLQRLTGLEIEKLAERIRRAGRGDRGLRGDPGRRERSCSTSSARTSTRSRRSTATSAAPRSSATSSDFDIEDLIADEDVVVTSRHDGYIKRMPLTTYRRQGRGGQGIIGSDAKEGDFIEHLFIASHARLPAGLHQQRARCYWLKVYDIPAMARTVARAGRIVNLLQMQQDETHLRRDPRPRVRRAATSSWPPRSGQIKKTAAGRLRQPAPGRHHRHRPRRGRRADRRAPITGGNDEIILGTAQRAGRSASTRPTSARWAAPPRGVRGINLRKGDEVVDMAIVDAMATLLTVCENGYGKRTELRGVPPASAAAARASSTSRPPTATARSSRMKSIRDADELMLITANGMIVRTGLDEIRTIGRATQGVRLINLKRRRQAGQRRPRRRRGRRAGLASVRARAGARRGATPAERRHAGRGD